MKSEPSDPVPRPPVVLVDDHGRERGTAGIVDAHRGRGERHLAFTAVVVDHEDQLVLGRRAPGKPLWPGHWDGTFASHPLVGEAMGAAVRRRANEELGVALDGVPAAAIEYRVDDPGAPGRGAALAEHEYCAVYLVRLASTDALAPVASEIDAVRRVSTRALLAAGEAVWRSHCPWLALALEALRTSGVPTAFERAFAPLSDPAAKPSLHAAIAVLVDGGHWRTAPVLQNWK